MKVLMHTLSKPEPTEELRELKHRHSIRMKFSDYGVMLADEDFAELCIIQFRWKENLVDFRFQDKLLGNKNVVVRVNMDDCDDTVFEKFTEAQELVEKHKDESLIESSD